MDIYDRQKEWWQKQADEAKPIGWQCFCIGPQRGEPYCPCEMRARGIIERDGRWIEPEHDLGPVRR